MLISRLAYLRIFLVSFWGVVLGAHAAESMMRRVYRDERSDG